MTTRTAPTPHGDIAYETVDCDSCENEVRKADALKFVMLEDVQTDKSRFNCHRWEARHYTTGWACPYCYDNGPIDYPRTRRVSRLAGDFWRALLSDPDMDIARFGTVLYVAMSVATILVLASEVFVA